MLEKWWTPEREELLRQHWTQLSGEPLREAVGAPTLNMCIGKAYRLGLPKRTRKKGIHWGSGRKTGTPLPPSLPKPQIEPETIAPVTFLELERNMCRWPLGKPLERATHFCGAPKAEGPYCPDHYRIATVQRGR